MRKKRGLTGTITIVIIIVALVLIVFNLVIKNVKTDQKKGEMLPTTEASKLLAKDLKDSYPATPREVLKLYGRITTCKYNQALKEDKLKKLIQQERLLYASDYAEVNPLDQMLEKFQKERKEFRKDKRVVASYTVQKSTEAVYKTVEGKEEATLGTSYLINGNSGYTKVFNQFLLRLEDKQWRIVGYKVVDSLDMND